MERDEENQFQPWKQSGCERYKEEMEHNKRFRKSPCGLQSKGSEEDRRPNEAGEVEDEDIMILSSDRELYTSVTERVSQMFSSTPAFTGICGSIDLFQAPTALPSHTEISETSVVMPVFEGPEVTAVSNRPEGRRKRKKSIEQSTSVSDLLPLQREVLLKQIEVFSGQLQLIEEQRSITVIKSRDF